MTACGVLFSATPVFPETPLIAIVAVSFPISQIVSVVGLNVTVPVVAPALIVISSSEDVPPSSE